MNIYQWENLTESERKAVLERPVNQDSLTTRNTVRDIIADVRKRGDHTLRELAERFDRVCLDELQVSQTEIDEAAALVDPATQEALTVAIANIERFHAAQTHPTLQVETMPGVQCQRISRPIERIGIYAPGGSAPLPSTVLMAAIPARIAGCPLRILCTPPRLDGSIDPVILLAAKLTGIAEIFKVGGAQAIAAMAYGTPSIPKVDKIVGPGNAWVTEAKLQVSQDPEGAAFDMPAGPSEVLVLADETAEATFIAADLLAQAEHGPDSQAIALTTSEQLAEQILGAMHQQIETLSRQDILKQSLQSCRIIVCQDLKQAFAISNHYAPEHLILPFADAASYLDQVQNAGSVFVGPWSPESVGDYASGTNHVLPTYGYARCYSGLSVDAFVKRITIQNLSSTGLAELGPHVERLATVEGLDAHRLAVTVRLQAMKGGSNQ